MAGVQISGLASGINWTTIVNELVAADSVGVQQVQAQQTGVNNQISALGTLTTDMNNVSSDLFTLENPNTYGGVTAASTTPNSTWTASALAGTPPASVSITVSTLATASQLNGAARISTGLNGSNGSDVDNLTLASMPTATAVTAGVFTINGHQITVTTSESLQDIFTAISAATGADVTGAYDPSADKVTLTSGSHTPIILGAANDTSNLLQVLGLNSNGEGVVTSQSALGTLQLNQDIGNSNLATPVTGTDGSGNGSFEVNGVSISYNVNTDTLSTVLGLITNSSAGVTASYDATGNQVVLTNNTTGDTGISVSDTTGNLMAALGLTGAAGGTLAQGANAEFKVNNGSQQISTSNTLTPTELGTPGLSVTVDTEDTQTVQVTAQTAPITTAINQFITDFNQMQNDIQNDTLVNVSSSGTIGTSILSSDTEVGDWASTLQMDAFDAGSALSGPITSLDSLGIDFNGTSGDLEISDSAQLQQALTQNPTAVAAFFQTAKTGFGSIMTAAINDTINQSASEQSTLQNQSSDLGTQISTMQTQVSDEQTALDAEFQAMEDAISTYNSDTQALNSFLGSGSSGSSSSTSSLGNLGTSVNQSVAADTSSSSSSSSSSSTSTS